LALADAAHVGVKVVPLALALIKSPLCLSRHFTFNRVKVDGETSDEMKVNQNRVKS